MSVRTERFILFFIGLYLVFFSVVWSRSLVGATNAAQPQVLGDSLSVLPELPGLPNMDTLMTQTNRARAEAGLTPLVATKTLTRLAQQRAADMANRQYYAHKNPDGLFYYDYLKGSQLADVYSCENLAMGSDIQTGPYVRQWLGSSSGHRQCVMHPTTTSVGYGVSELKMENGKSDDKTYIIVAIHAEQ